MQKIHSYQCNKMLERKINRDGATLCFVDKMEKVFPYGDAQEKVDSIIAIIGEKTAFQAIVRTKKPLYNAKISIGGDLKKYITVKRVECVPSVVAVRENADDYVVNDGKSGVYPDLLCDVNLRSINLAPEINYGFYFIIKPTEKLLDGEYTVTVKIKDEFNKIVASNVITIKITRLTLEPIKRIITNWMHMDCICDAHHVKPYSAKFYKILDKYVNLAMENGVNTIFVPLFTPPLDTHNDGERTNVQLIDIKVENGNYIFDFKKLEVFLDYCLNKGFAFFEFSHLFSQWGAKYSPNIYAKVNGKKSKIFSLNKEVFLSGYDKFLESFLSCLIPFLKTKGIYDCSLFHISDEPKLKDVNQYLACKKIISAFVEENKIVDALSEYKFYNDNVVKQPIVEISSIDSFIDKNVDNLGVYYCFQHNNNYVSNRLFSMPLQRTRIIGIQLYLNDINTFLHWGFNFYNDFLSINKVNPFFNTDLGRFLPSGDGFVVYPNVKENGAFSSLRLEILYQAFLDCRLLETLEKKKGKIYVKELLEREGLRRFNVYPRSIKWHNSFVEKVITLIKE